MSRRQRHWNPKHAGANLVLDARHVAAGTLTTWPDRSGNSNDATEATNPPSATISSGRPVVRFDGTNDQIITANTITYAEAFAVARMASTAGSRSGLVCPPVSGLPILIRLLNNFEQVDATSSLGPSSHQYRVDGVSGGINAAVVPQSNLGICGSRTGNGGTIAMRFAIGTDRGLSGRWWNGDVGAVLSFSVQLSSALRKRIEHALALSFKIACS